MTVTIEHRDGVAIIGIDHPPVNALGFAVRRALFDAIELARETATARAIVITGKGRSFSAGADIREFNTPEADRAPTLHTLIDQIESSSKPVVAAIHGSALGGGLEVALAAHYRVARGTAIVGLPEVTLGILPGAGGTQRLPRAVGLERALDMIVGGKPVRARELANTALFDRVVDGDVVALATSFAADVAAQGGPWPRLRDRSVQQANPGGFIGFARTAVAAVSGFLPAPLACVDAVLAAVERPFDEGIRLEREAFSSLVNGSVSRAIRHAFFAERAARQLSDVGPEVKPREVRRVAVLGAGTMGGGICMSFLDAGIPVMLLDTSKKALERAVATIARHYDSSVKKGKLSAEQVEQRMSLLEPMLGHDGLRLADLIIEAVFEDYSVKEAVFRQLDAVAKKGAILATNTSTLDIQRIARVTGRPGDVVGLHFFSPAHVMKLLEVVRTEQTSKDVLATVLALAKTIQKTPVVARVCDGFIGNRMLHAYVRQAGFLLDEGALPQQVDRAIEEFGFAMGPFRMGDLAGNDIGWAIRKRRYAENPNTERWRAADRLCELGRFGQKTGKGWYDYEPGDRTAHPSTEVEALLAQTARESGAPRRTIDDQEIVDRLLFALVNEGASILDEGIAARASDIDVVYLTGYGFPVHRGGPMFHADSLGLQDVLAAIRRFSKGYQGQVWTPAPLLVRLAEAGKSFNGRAAFRDET
jgi:3-hydroxyacyl-CoA dehydrogenase